MSSGVVTISNGLADEELKKLYPTTANPTTEKGERKMPSELKEEKFDSNERRRRGNKINLAFFLKYISLSVLVLQNTSQVLVMRYATTRSSNEHPPFLKTVAVFFNEVVKFVAALFLFFLTTQNFSRSILLLKHHFITNFLDTLKVGVPAFIYVIQNFLLYVAVENLDAGTYMVTYQLKILTTAMFTVLMLKRKLSIQQWVALLVLIAGVAIVQISANQKGSSSSPSYANSTVPLAINISTANPLSSGTTMMPNITAASQTPSPQKDNSSFEQNPLLGFAAIIVACFLSGFAGIYFEKILKASDVSVWLRNTQLAALSIPIGLIVIAVKDGQRVHEKGFMQGFDYIVWIVVLLQALGGLVVAVVIKYADNILKAFATSISIVFATVASIFIFSIYPKMLFIAGAILVMAAVALYGIFPSKKKPLKIEEDAKGEELQVIVKSRSKEEEDDEKRKEEGDEIKA